MICKTIHYCKFGNSAETNLLKRCKDSWMLHLKGYEFKEWNESNFDVNSHPYTKRAYEKKLYAFVADYVRMWALFNYGGIYLDTDVEVFKSFDDLLDSEVFLGFETDYLVATCVIGAEKGSGFIGEFFAKYENKRFAGLETNVDFLADFLRAKGFKLNGSKYEEQGRVKIYPQRCFSPKDRATGKFEVEDDTYCVHHFAASWLPWYIKFEEYICKVLGIRCRSICYRFNKKYLSK